MWAKKKKKQTRQRLRKRPKRDRDNQSTQYRVHGNGHEDAYQAGEKTGRTGENDFQKEI